MMLDPKGQFKVREACLVEGLCNSGAGCYWRWESCVGAQPPQLYVTFCQLFFWNFSLKSFCDLSPSTLYCHCSGFMQPPEIRWATAAHLHTFTSCLLLHTCAQVRLPGRRFISGPCWAQSLAGSVAGPLLPGCISCFPALAVGLLITRDEEMSQQEGEWVFKRFKREPKLTRIQKGSFNEAQLYNT